MLEFSRGIERYKDKKEELHYEVPPLAFNCPNQYSYFKKGSEKGSDSVDFYCNVVKFEISKIA